MLTSTLIPVEPLYTERYVRWCERSAGETITCLVLNYALFHDDAAKRALRKAAGPVKILSVGKETVADGQGAVKTNRTLIDKILHLRSASLFFISYNVSYREFDIISMVASVLLLILRLAIFIHGVLLPDRVVTLAGKAYRRNWSPGTMFVILVVGSPVAIPAFLINSSFYYRLCLLGAGIFFLSLFVLSFIYEYIDSKENQDDRFRRTVIGIVAVFLILCVLGYVAFTTVPK